jgi:hypothetical protein
MLWYNSLMHGDALAQRVTLESKTLLRWYIVQSAPALYVQVRFCAASICLYTDTIIRSTLRYTGTSNIIALAYMYHSRCADTVHVRSGEASTLCYTCIIIAVC